MEASDSQQRANGPPTPTPTPTPAPEAQAGRGARCGWLFHPLLYLTPSALINAHNSRGDWRSLAFISFSYMDLLSLFFCLRRFERLGQESGASGEKARIRVAVWVLSTALMVAFGCRVWPVVPWALGAMIWAMTGIVAGGGFYGLFLYEKESGKRG